MKNPCAKTVKRQDAYEVWEKASIGWTWYVLKKYQADDEKSDARWFCLVTSPLVPNGEMGDVYVNQVKDHALRIK